VVRCSTTPQLVREVAQKASDFAGDGTTTATVLVQSIVRGSEIGRRQHATKIPSVHLRDPCVSCLCRLQISGINDDHLSPERRRVVGG
jgi:hypothetical protein